MLKSLTAYFDGASKGNPGPSGIGGVILEHGKIVEEISRAIGTGTNNRAEYSALIAVLEKAKELGAQTLSIYSDSELVVRQLNGEYQIKDPNLRQLYNRVAALRGAFRTVTFRHVPREQNRKADALANSALGRSGAVKEAGTALPENKNGGITMKKFLESDLPEVPAEQADIFILGLPLQGTVNSRPGAVQGPQAIRLASACIETYSPFLKKNASTLKFHDGGDIEIRGKGQNALESLSQKILEKLPRNARPVFLGGDHSVSYAAIKALAQRGEKFSVIHLDAHPDSQDEFEGEAWCYATVMRRSKSHVAGQIYQLGIRTGTPEEFEYAETHNKLFLRDRFEEGLNFIIRRERDKNVYVSFDIDALDPGWAPGTSNPVSGGLNPEDVRQLLDALKACRVIGFDMVEVAPNLDPTGLTSIAAAEIVRDAMLSWWS